MSSTDRRWLEVGVRCPPDDVRAPLLVDGLIALGGRAAEERDGWYVTHLESRDDLASFESEARSLLASATGMEDLELRTSWKEDEDWAETWKRGLGFRRITDRVGIRPSWVPEPTGAPDVVVVVDPGMAFGTAEHGTTRGCLRLLDGVVSNGERLLDVGSGSGILAIAAALLGAAEVIAIEADPLAFQALNENVALNRVEDRVRSVEGSVGAGELGTYGPVDGVVANIEMGTLRRLLPGCAAAVRPAGWLVLSGVLAEEWPVLRKETERHGFELERLDEDGEWCTGLFRRRDAAARI